jgi:hypothetical protein
MDRSNNVFAPVVLALLLTVLAASAALMAWGAAERYLPELNIEAPELAKHQPELGPAPARASRRVVLVIMDGLRLDSSFGLPTLDRMRRAGVDAIATSHYPSISRPNHVTLVTGVPPLVSGVRNNTFKSPVHLDSVMDRIRAAGMTATYVADDSPGLGYMFGDDFEALYYGRWPGALVKSSQLALRQGKSSLLVLIPGAIDLAGHDSGGNSPEYREAAEYVDTQLKEALQLVDLQQDTVIITADHGHTDRGGHGGEEPEVLQVPLILAGAGIRADGLLGTAELADIAPTIAALLGVPAPVHGFGRTLTEVLALEASEEEAIKKADTRRFAQNSALYLRSVEGSKSEAFKSRRNRLFWFAAFVLGAMALVWIAGRGGALFIDWRVLLIALPAYPLCYYGLINLLGESLSFSALQDRGSEMSNLSRFGLVATVAHLVAGWLVLRGRVVLRDRLAAANALVACGLLVAWLPAGLLWVYHGSAPHVVIPGSRVALLIPANYIAVATYALGAALLLVLEFVVFFARAVDPRIRLRRMQVKAALRRIGPKSRSPSQSP